MSLEDKLILIMRLVGVLLVHEDDRDDFFMYVAILLNHIWKARNNIIFK